MSDFKPSRYYVYCSVPSTDRNNKTGVYTFRVGVTNDKAAIPSIIAEDQKSIGQTYDGLIEPELARRTYSAFEAEWTEIKLR